MAWLPQKRTAAKSCAQQYALSSVELPTSRIQAASDPTQPRGQDQDVYVCERSIFKHRVFGFRQKKNENLLCRRRSMVSPAKC